MTFASMVALGSAIGFFASIPGPVSVAIISRSLSLGFRHAFFTALGVVTIDLIYVLASVLGLTMIIASFENAFLVIRIVGGSYLIWLGISAIRASAKAQKLEKMDVNETFVKSYISGLVINGSNTMAALFYLSFLPTFVDLKNITVLATLECMATIFISVMCVLNTYAYIAHKAKSLLKDEKTLNKINIASGVVMCLLGLFLIFFMGK